MTQFSGLFCSKNRMLVVSETGTAITVAGTGDENRTVRDRIANSLGRKHPGKKISFIQIPEPELMLRISSLEPVGPQAKPMIPGEMPQSCEIASITAGAPAVTVLNSLLLEAKNGSVSDIHLERHRGGTEVRFRSDGVLRTVHRFDAGTGKSLSVRIKLLANLNTLEFRKPQDGRFGITAGTTEHDIRVSIVPSIDGESIVLRFLDTGDTEIRLQDLQFRPPIRAYLENIARLPQGLVLVTGPTGSGKTTTLAALVRECRNGERKIISIEDPVEFRIPGVTQIQTNENLGLGFGELMRRVLRQDPDILTIGEIRDGETAELAVRAALTGHLVLATLHTRSAKECAARFAELGIPGESLQNVLHAVLNQRLLRRTCRRCAGTGCVDCSFSGYSGRIPAAELHVPGDAAGRYGATLAEAGADLVHSGLTDERELIRIMGDRP